MMQKPDVLVLGAGPAGLAAAVALLQGGLEPLVLESAVRAGGSVATHRENGFIAEGGPNSLLLENDGTEDFLRQLGIVILEANPVAKKRFLVCRGRPVAAPSGPIGAITTPLLGFLEKLRVLGEPFARTSTDPDESVAAFARRRLGAGVVTRLVDPMIAGVYAGDAEKLSVRQALPRLYEMEQRYGSLLFAGLSKGRAAPRRRMVNFPGGMADIPDGMARFLDATRLQTSAAVRTIEHNPGSGWTVTWDADGEKRCATARFLVLAVPPWNWSALPLPVALGDHLRPWHDVSAPPVSVISLGFTREQVAHPLDGFGVLAPAIEHRNVLGVLFPSSLFQGRAPDGHVLLTSFVGGCRQPELTRGDAGTQIGIVRKELETLLGARGEPVFTSIRHWPRAIPQYNIGYGNLRALLDSAEANFSGLHFCGGYRNGIALPKTIRNALDCAEKILATAH